MDVLKPSVALLCNLASAIVHADEYLSSDGHEFDKEAFTAILRDPDVIGWLEGMSALALAPRKRSAG